MLAPLAAVLLFLAAIISAFWYLRLEEMDREQEAVRRDVEYAQQRMRLRLLERQEQLMRMARDISNKEVDRKSSSAAPNRWSPSTPSCRCSPGSTSAAASRPLRRAQPPGRAAAPAGRRAAPRRDRSDVQPGARPAAARVLATGRGGDSSGLLQLHVPLADQASSAA
jgi:predicted outer membrane lipoprotein